MNLERTHIKTISATVHRRFPELKNVAPNVRAQAVPKNVRTEKDCASGPIRFLLTFRGTATLPGGKSMQRVVRVIANDKGQVLKMALSK